MTQAHWISPDGEVLTFHEERHIDFVARYPEKFGVEKRWLEEAYRAAGARFGAEDGVVRKQLFRLLYQQGWIRIREWAQRQWTGWSVESADLTEERRAFLAEWAASLVRADRHDPHAMVRICRVGKDADYDHVAQKATIWEIAAACPLSGERRLRFLEDAADLPEREAWTTGVPIPTPESEARTSRPPDPEVEVRRDPDAATPVVALQFDGTPLRARLTSIRSQSAEGIWECPPPLAGRGLKIRFVSSFATAMLAQVQPFARGGRLLRPGRQRLASRMRSDFELDRLLRSDAEGLVSRYQELLAMEEAHHLGVGLDQVSYREQRSELRRLLRGGQLPSDEYQRQLKDLKARHQEWELRKLDTERSALGQLEKETGVDLHPIRWLLEDVVERSGDGAELLEAWREAGERQLPTGDSCQLGSSTKYAE